MPVSGKQHSIDDVKAMKKLILIFTAALLFASCATNKAGKSAPKTRVVASVTEYDERGNEIHYKDPNGAEQWYEYTYWENGAVRTKTYYVCNWIFE